MATTTNGQIVPRSRLIVIIGPTGTGKSNLAVAIAKHLAQKTPITENGASSLAAEIINADAMQMYEGLPIITNKLSVAEQQGVPHHLLGTIHLEEDPWSVNRFMAEADRCIRDVRARGRIPIVVGGTGYYVHALLLFGSTLNSNSPNEDDEHGASKQDGEEMSGQIILSEDRQKEMDEILDGSTKDIYAKLKEIDPDMAAMWHPNDRRKLRRSLEIWYKTGRKASQVYAEQEQNRKEVANPAIGADGAPTPSARLRYDPLIFWLDAEDALLKDRLNQRVDTMLKTGLTDEANEMYELDKALVSKGVVTDQDKGIWASIGFKELQPWLEHVRKPNVDPLGEESVELKTACIEAIKASTRRYAKRQNRYIRIRLSSALADARIDRRLFPLDTSDLSLWKSSVEDPAKRIVDTFLQGGELPAPQTTSIHAKTSLAPKSSPTSASGRRARFCNVCDRVLMTEPEWDGHLKSKTHRKALEGIKRRKVLHELFEAATSENTA